MTARKTPFENSRERLVNTIFSFSDYVFYPFKIPFNFENVDKSKILLWLCNILQLKSKQLLKILYNS